MFTFESKQNLAAERRSRSFSSWPQTIIQPKLRIHPGKDRYEREADRAAEQVIGKAEPPAFAPRVDSAALGVQRECHCGGTCAACHAEQSDHKHQHLQLNPAGPNSDGLHAPPVVHEVLNSPGQPLDARTRAFMEPRFGFDFSRVRVHSGEEAERSARAVGALAYTVGPNIVFGDGQYQPSGHSGRRLLAHELAHVVQQEGTPESLQRKPDPDNKDKKDKPGKQPKQADAPDCTFSVNYGAPREIDCDTVFQKEKRRKPPGKMCGRALLFDIESVAATGSKCPPLKGLKLTETREGEGLCMPPGFKFEPLQDCPPIEANGKLKNCTDIYSICALLRDINDRTNAGCDETITQKLFVGGKDAGTHTIVWSIDANETDCTTEVKRDGKVILKRR